MTRLLPLVFLTLGLALSARAQTSKAAITGRITDASKAVLQGAELTLLPSGEHGVSNQTGEFTITDIAPGNYKLIVSYVGFKNFEIEITAAAGEVKRVDADLAVNSSAESMIVSAGRAHGEAEAIERTRTSDNLVQVLAADVITSLPNANVADALGRLPSITLARDEGEGIYVQVRGTEPRLTNVTINGISVPSPESGVRQVRLDSIPADLVESVEVNKTLVANQDGDGIGGAVNLKTKTAGDLPSFTLNGLGGYNSILGGRFNDQFGGTVGKRFGKTKKFGLLFGGSYDRNGRGIDDMEPAIDPTSTPGHILYSSNTVREYRYYRTRFGFAGSADYKINDFTDIYVKAIYSDLKDFGDKWYYGPAATAASKFYTSSKRPEFSIGSASLGGRHVMTTSWINWELSASRAYQISSAGNPKADFSYIGSKLTCGYDPNAQTTPYRPMFGNNCDGPNSPLLNPAVWGFKDITTSTGTTAQLNLTAAVSYNRTYRVAKHFANFETGFKIRNAHKNQNATETVYDGWSANSYPMTGFLSDFSTSNYYDKSFYGGKYGPTSDFNKLVTYTQTNLSNFVDGYKTAQNSYPNQFSLIERITAGYLMNSIDLGKLRIVGGLRFENTAMNTLGYNVILYPAGSKNCPNATGCGTPSPVKNNPSYFDPLPSLHLRYALTADSDIRAVYARGLARPDAYQLVPYATQDDSTNPATIAIGNPNLRASHANNYDLLYERFLKPAGLFQAGFFYKQLSAPLLNTQYTPGSGTNAGELVTQWVNGTNSKLYGFEVSYQQRLAFLPGPLKGFGLSANYSWTDSKLKALPGRLDSPALQRQTPNSWNISPTYDRGRLSARLGLTYNGTAIYQYAYQRSTDVSGQGPRGPSGDTYVYAHSQVDAQGSYRVARGLQLLAYGLNLSNEPFGYYIGNPRYVKQREYYKATYAAGFRYTFTGKE